MYHIPFTLQCIYGHNDEGGENGDGEEGREWRLPGLLYTDYLVLCGEAEEDLRAMVGRFFKVCRIDLNDCIYVLIKIFIMYTHSYIFYPVLTLTFLLRGP